MFGLFNVTLVVSFEGFDAADDSLELSGALCGAALNDAVVCPARRPRVSTERGEDGPSASFVKRRLHRLQGYFRAGIDHERPSPSLALRGPGLIRWPPPRYMIIISTQRRVKAAEPAEGFSSYAHPCQNIQPLQR